MEKAERKKKEIRLVLESIFSKIDREMKELITFIIVGFIRMLVMAGVILSHVLFQLFEKSREYKKPTNYFVGILLYIINIPLFIINMVIAPHFDH